MTHRASHVDNSVLNATALVGAAARRKAQDNDRIGRFQVDPVLGRHVVKGEQGVRLVGDLGDGLRPLGLELVREGLDGRLGVGLVLGVAYLRQRPAGGRLD